MLFAEQHCRSTMRCGLSSISAPALMHAWQRGTPVSKHNPGDFHCSHECAFSWAVAKDQHIHPSKGKHLGEEEEKFFAGGLWRSHHKPTKSLKSVLHISAPTHYCAVNMSDSSLWLLLRSIKYSYSSSNLKMNRTPTFARALITIRSTEQL